MSIPTGPSINSSLSLEKPVKAVLVAAKNTCHVDHLGIIAYDAFCSMQVPVKHVIRLFAYLETKIRQAVSQYSLGLQHQTC